MTSPYDKRSAKPQAYEWIRFGEIKPAGWMHTQMQRDLVHGFVGHLDELVPDLIQKDDIYGKDRPPVWMGAGYARHFAGRRAS